MAKRITITMPGWLFDSIEAKRKATNRSEFISQHLIKSLGEQQ